MDNDEKGTQPDLKDLPLLLIGPLVFCELADKYLGTTTFVVTDDARKFNAYCASEVEKNPAFMLKDQRWDGMVQEVEAGHTYWRILKPEVALSTSDDISKSLIFFSDFALLGIHSADLNTDDIRYAAENDNLPRIIKILPEGAALNDNH
jgi:hypothetical protein